MSILQRSAIFSVFALCSLLAHPAWSQSYSDLILSGNPLLYWNFDESGDTDDAIDLVGADVGDNLVAEGNATRIASASTTGGLSLGRAASFDGTQFSKFYSGSLSPATNPDAWALEMWVRPQGVDPGDRFDYLLEARGGTPNSPGLLFDYGFNDRVEAFGGGERTEAGGAALANDAWQHLVVGNFGAANDRIDFYLNGAAAGSVAYAADVPFGTDQIAVGNSVPGNADFDHFAGQIDELAVYDLSGQSIANINGKLQSLATHFSVSEAGMPGDANQDGHVDGLDFDLISLNLFTQQSPGSGGDLDLNAYVDFADFRLWKNVAPPEIAALYSIPEPASFTLAIIGLLSVCRRARKC